MERVGTTSEVCCPSPDISAYLDGELTPDQELRLDLHMAGCRVCSDELNLQKSILNALDGSFDEKSIELPTDFTKTVVAHAESRVSGLRHPSERRRAAVVLAILLVFAYIVLGSNVGVVLDSTTAIAEKVIAVVFSAGYLVYNIALATVVVFKSLVSGLVFGSGANVVILLLVFVVSLLLSSRLLVRFHRT